MRILFFLILLAGVALGIVYPAAIDYFSGDMVARLAVYERAAGFRPVSIPLAMSDAPVRVMLDVVTTDVFAPPNASAHLTVTASVGGRTVMAKPVLLVSQSPRESGSNEQRFGAVAGTLENVDDGDYRFEVGFGDAGTLPLRTIHLILRRNAFIADDRAQPIGYVLMAIGFVGFVLSLARGGGGRPPRGPQWGRDGAPAA